MQNINNHRLSSISFSRDPLFFSSDAASCRFPRDLDTPKRRETDKQTCSAHVHTIPQNDESRPCTPAASASRAWLSKWLVLRSAPHKPPRPSIHAHQVAVSTWIGAFDTLHRLPILAYAFRLEFFSPFNPLIILREKRSLVCSTTVPASFSWPSTSPNQTQHHHPTKLPISRPLALTTERTDILP